MNRLFFLLAPTLLLLCVSHPARADAVIGSVPTGIAPSAIAVNETTDRIYVVNSQSNNVTVIDGSTFATSPIVVGLSPSLLAVNAATDRIYVSTAAATTSP